VALTTNANVWKIVIVVTIFMTLVLSMLFYFEEIFIIFLVAVVLVFVTSKSKRLYDKLCEYVKFPKFIKRTVGYILLVGLLYGIYLIFVNAITGLSGVFSSNNTMSLNSYYLVIKDYIPEVFGKKIFTLETIAIVQTYIFDKLADFVSALPGYIVNAVLIIPLVFYMYFKKRLTIMKQAVEIVPVKFHDASKRAITRVGNQLKDFTNAKFYESFFIAFICIIGFYFSGIQGWLFLGILAGVLNIVPYLGPFVGAIPPLIVGLLNSPMHALFVLITVIIAQAFDNLYVIPFFISHKVKMDALLSIVLILAGAKLFGPLGMILAIPIFLIYKIVLDEVYTEVVAVYEGPKTKVK